MRNVNKKSGLFGRLLGEVLGRSVKKDTFGRERQAEAKVQILIKNAPRNRDISKDRFLHREVGRIPVFTLKRRKVDMSVAA